MTNAEHALHKAALDIPLEVCKRLEAASKLNDEDRQTIINIARKALAPFQAKPEATTEVKPKSKVALKEKS
jgi:F-type H+-transporting ATPase subunit alpha